MWMKVDDRLHAHRKTRRAISSHANRRRDVAPMGLWVLAGSWAGQNGTAGWVPEFELDRWDDDWPELAERLVKAGFWWPEQRDGEPGYAFTDWEDYNPSANSSEAGTFGNHKRWHLDRGLVSPECPHCPIVPNDIDEPDTESGGDIGGRSGGDIGGESRNIALPDPTRPDPTRKNSSADASKFDEWWAAYGKKVGRKKCEAAWAKAIKKKGVTADKLIDATRHYVAVQRANNKHPEFTKNPLTWLNGEHWDDDLPSLQAVAGDHFIPRPIDDFEYHDD